MDATRMPDKRISKETIDLTIKTCKNTEDILGFTRLYTNTQKSDLLNN